MGIINEGISMIIESDAAEEQAAERFYDAVLMRQVEAASRSGLAVQRPLLR